MPYPTITERPASESATGAIKEVAFGTPLTVTTFLPDTDNTMETNPGWFSPQLMMNTRDLQVFNLYGEATFTGTITGPFFPTNAATLFVGSIGTDAVTGSAPLYTHTISQANSLPSYTIEKNVGGFQSLVYAGCRIGKCTLNAPTANEPITVSYDITGQSAAILTTPTAVSVTNENPFVFAEGVFTLDTHARADVSNVQIMIDNGLKITYTFSGNHGPSFITPCTLHVNGTFTATWSSFNDATYGDYTTMVSGTQGALSLVFTHPGSNGASITITLPQVVLTKFVNDLKVSDVVMSNISFEASKSLGVGYTIQAVIQNSVSTAY